MNPTQIVVLALIIVAFAAYFTAAVAYHILAPWHESRTGRWYMAQLVAVTASLALILLNRVLGLAPAADPSPLVFAIYGLFAVVGIGTAATIITTQVTQARRQTEEDTKPLDVVEPEDATES